MRDLFNWLDTYRAEAEIVLKKGWVREVEFSGLTYQIEVKDAEEGQSYWSFLQFDEDGHLKDAFCSCPNEQNGCIHLAAAYLRAYDSHKQPLHIRFKHSFWNALGQILADQTGYEKCVLEKVKEGHYRFQNEIAFEIEAKEIKKLKQIIEERASETPENSIKFSSLAQEEISWWREGRPSPQLRYTLCFWSDLAKWMMKLQEENNYTLFFKENKAGLPTSLYIEFPLLKACFELKEEDLPRLIPALATVKSSLKLLYIASKEVKEITYDPYIQSFRIEHFPSDLEEKKEEGKQIGEWLYISRKGFYAVDRKEIIDQTSISSDQICTFLNQYHQEVARFISVYDETVTLSYTMHFDKKWNWHFNAYLFEKGDLEKPLSALFNSSWAYLHPHGFYPIEKSLFKTIKTVVPPGEVSSFINDHRVWLNGQAGFQTHLSSIESHLSYEVHPERGMRFFPEAFPSEGAFESKDFGDWLYYAKQGFFSKGHARLGFMIRPGVEIAPRDIPFFIKANREELESIPNFFTTRLPLQRRGLEISVKSETSIYVNPFYDPHSDSLHFYGDFIYLEKEGFCELPAQMRLPEAYQSPHVIGHDHLAAFFLDELPALTKYISKMDPRLKWPVRLNLEISYLSRLPRGGLKAELYYRTERGRVAVTDIWRAMEKRRRFLFSEAGLIDLHQETYQWIRHFKNPIYPEVQTLELSVMEFLRLEMRFGLQGPTDSAPTAEITRQLLAEIRNFTTREKPNLKGLTSELRLYQQTGLDWLWFLYQNGLSGLLCDEMGLGKTHQAMALMAAILNVDKEQKKRFLIVCPTSVIYHWQDKLATFLPKIKVHTFHGQKRTLKGLAKEGIVLTSYGILRMEKMAMEKINFELAIFDEIQIAKNSRSRVHQALMHIQSKMSVGLTGTPIENNLRELKSLFDVVLPNYMPQEAVYKEHFINPIEKEHDEEKKAHLTKLIHPFILRRRKSEVLQELPEKSEDKSYCDLSSEQAELYQQVLDTYRDSLLIELRDRERSINYMHIFSLLSQLKQICNHPALVAKDPKNYKHYQSGKWDLFVELLNETRESEQKVVVFSQYLYMLDIIESYLQELGWGYAQIRGDTINRREELKRFQEDPNCIVFIGSLQAAGLGIDLTAASVVILYDRWWNAARENQAIDRVHRIGQKWGVQVYKLITKATIEEKIDRLITKKGRLLEEVITADDQGVFKRFTRQEMIDLFTYHPMSS
ncbi:MAG: DEAD/DEAH box helicase [Chlamydiales bacterium]